MSKKKSGSGLVVFALFIGIGLSALIYYYQANLSAKEQLAKENQAKKELVKSLTINEPAPDFLAVDSKGVTQRLSSFRGKVVVIEWKNYDCPFVKKQYASNTMQSLQKMATEKDVVWLSIVSSAEGQQGFESPEDTNARLELEKAFPTAVLLDQKGVVAKLYHAKVTPHMFIIDTKGILVYQGAIDDKASTDQADIPTAVNYVKKALMEIWEGLPVSENQTEPYGCSVKYAES